MAYIYKRISGGDLYQDLKQMGRDNFSYHGAKALMEHIEELAQDLGDPQEYDPIAYCCEFTEYSDIEEFNEAMGKDFKSIDDIRDETQVIEFENGFIVQSY